MYSRWREGELLPQQTLAIGKEMFLGLQVLIIDPKKCESKYVALQLKQKVKIFKHISRGTTIAGVTKKQLLDLTIDLPPILDQKRIVAKIEELFTRLDAGVENLKKTRQLLKNYRQAVLRDAFTGKLTGRVHHQDTKAPRELPDGWKQVNFSSILENVKYGTSKKCIYERESGDSPVIRIPNLKDGKIDQSDLKYAVLTDEEKHDYSLLKGDILIIRSNGSISLVGTSSIISEKEKDFAYAGYLIRLRCQKSFEQEDKLLAAEKSVKYKIK